MSKISTTKSLTPARYTKLFGPAPVLSSEHLSEYESMLMYLSDCIKPRDFIEQMMVKDLADFTWEIRRYLSHKTLLIEREHLRHQAMEAKRRQHARKLQRELAEQRKAKQAKEAEQVDQTQQAAQPSAATTQVERAMELEDVVDASVSDVDDILDEPADEIDHAKALQSEIDYYERLDRLETATRAQRDDVLNQIEFHRQGLGSVSRRASDAVIDAEFTESKHEALPINGPNDKDAAA